MHNLRNLLGLSSAVAGNGAVTVVIAGPPVAKGRKATDEQIAQSYERSGSVWATARELGMCGQSVHERLVRMGRNKLMNVFTEVEKDRLQAEYWIAAETGKLAELAADMGRTKQFLCRQAKALGLTRQNRSRKYISTWKYVGEESALIFFEQFKCSRLNLKQYCNSKGYDDLGFSQCMKRHFADEWEHVIEAKQTAQTCYRLGRQFEYRVRDDLRARGYFALRSPASKTPVDLVALQPGQVLLVQCKRGGLLGVQEWNALFDLATSCGAIAVLASSPTGRGTLYEQLLARKDGSKQRQPKGPFTALAGQG